MTIKEDSIMEDFFNSITPNYNFNDRQIPVVPDYSIDQNWAALPNFSSLDQLLPKGMSKNISEKEVNCFFIHPTGFFLTDL